MIKYKKGNILLEPAEALVNTLNCVGVMGRGIALQFKNHTRRTLRNMKQLVGEKKSNRGRCLYTKLAY